MSDADRDLAAFNRYLELWQSENPIKTNKLQILLLTNGLLLAASALTVNEQWLLNLGGCFLNLVWLLSIGRTSLFQKVWQSKLTQIAHKPDYADDPRFQILETAAAESKAAPWLRLLGGVSSKYYLVGSPLMLALFWLARIIID